MSNETQIVGHLLLALGFAVAGFALGWFGGINEGRRRAALATQKD